MTKELVFDVAERIIAFTADVVDLVDDTCRDPRSGLCVSAFNGLAGGFVAIDTDAAQGVLNVAEQAVLDSDATSKCMAGSGRSAAACPGAGSARG